MFQDLPYHQGGVGYLILGDLFSTRNEKRSGSQGALKTLVHKRVVVVVVIGWGLSFFQVPGNSNLSHHTGDITGVGRQQDSIGVLG